MSDGKGPMSKNAVSGGSMFPIKEKEASPGGTLGKFSNNPGDSRSAIMSLNARPPSFSSNVEAAMTNTPSK